MPIRSLGGFVDSLQATGRYTFLKAEALRALGVSGQAFKMAARRLMKKKRLAMPRRGFFVVVPVEYRSFETLPVTWFIRDLMRFHGHPYYVGILSAAELHGAAHQKPQEFQVVTDAPLRPIVVGRSRIRFFTKKSIGETPTAEVKTQTGMIRVSTPEATAFDLLRYARNAGGMGNVATVLTELSERIDPNLLVRVARTEAEPAHAQRLGFLLEKVRAKRAAAPLAKWIARRKPTPIPLQPGQPFKDFPLSRRWQVIVNEEVESDL